TDNGVDVHGCFRKTSDTDPKGYFNNGAGAGNCTTSKPCIQKSGNTWKTTGSTSSANLNAYAAIPRSSYADYDPSTKAVPACSDPSKTVEQCVDSCSDPAKTTEGTCGDCNHLGYSSSAVTSHTAPDTTGWANYDCSSPATTGTFILNGDCTLSAEVILTGDLTLVGSDTTTLKTITAATGKRHFFLAGDILNLWHVKLTGGDRTSTSNNANSQTNYFGGSIFISTGGGTLNLYYSKISGNKACRGGGVGTRGATNTNRNAIVNIYNSIISDNEADKCDNSYAGEAGGISLKFATSRIDNSIIDNNIAGNGAGIQLFSSEATITNTIISNNDASGYGNELVTYFATVTLINTVIPNVTDNIEDWGETTWTTCSASPCTVAPFTGACSAVDASDDKLGVICPDVTATEETCGTCNDTSLVTKSTCEASGIWTGAWAAGTWTTRTVLRTRCDSHDACKAACNADSNCEIYQEKIYYESTKVFGGANCTDPSNCEAQCNADADCEGFTSTCTDDNVDATAAACIDSCADDGTVEDACGSCNDNSVQTETACINSYCTDGTTAVENECGSCAAPHAAKTSSTTCIDECSDSSGTTADTCGTCSDTSKTLQSQCIDSWCSSDTSQTTQETCGTCTSSGTTDDTCGTCSDTSQTTLVVVNSATSPLTSADAKYVNEAECADYAQSLGSTYFSGALSTPTGCSHSSQYGSGNGATRWNTATTTETCNSKSYHCVQKTTLKSQCTGSSCTNPWNPSSSAITNSANQNSAYWQEYYCGYYAYYTEKTSGPRNTALAVPDPGSCARYGNWKGSYFGNGDGTNRPTGCIKLYGSYYIWNSISTNVHCGTTSGSHKYDCVQIGGIWGPKVWTSHWTAGTWVTRDWTSAWIDRTWTTEWAARVWTDDVWTPRNLSHEYGSETSATDGTSQTSQIKLLAYGPEGLEASATSHKKPSSDFCDNKLPGTLVNHDKDLYMCLGDECAETSTCEYRRPACVSGGVETADDESTCKSYEVVTSGDRDVNLMITQGECEAYAADTIGYTFIDGVAWSGAPTGCIALSNGEVRHNSHSNSRPCGYSGHNCIQLSNVKVWDPEHRDKTVFKTRTCSHDMQHYTGLRDECPVGKCRIDERHQVKKTCHQSANPNHDTALSFAGPDTSSYVINGAADPEVRVCVNEAISFTRSDAGHPLRVVAASECTGCETGTHSNPSNHLSNWVDVQGSSTETYTFTSTGNYYYLCTAHSNMVGALIVEDCMQNFNGEIGTAAGQCERKYEYSDSTAIFSGTACTDASDCEAQCSANADCEGYTSRCSVPSKTTEDSCGTCSDPAKTTEGNCGHCHHLGYSASAVTSSHTTPDTTGWGNYDCDNPATSGTFILNGDCTLSAEVILDGDLTIVGTSQDMSALNTMTAASTKRHFKIIGTRKLELWYVKLTGGDVSSVSSNDMDDKSGGAIFTRSGWGGTYTLNLYFSEISGNKAYRGGGIKAVGSGGGLSLLNIHNSIVKDNVATDSSGGVYVNYATVTIMHTIIDNNEASGTVGYGGGLVLDNCVSTVTNTMISNNKAYRGGGIQIYNGNGPAILRQVTFDGNDATEEGDEILGLDYGGGLFLINTLMPSDAEIDTIMGSNTPNSITCSDNPCTVAPYTGACAAVDANNDILGVTCAHYSTNENTCGTCSNTSLTTKTTCEASETWTSLWSSSWTAGVWADIGSAYSYGALTAASGGTSKQREDITMTLEVSEDCTSSASVHCSDPVQVTTQKFSYASSVNVFKGASCSDLSDCQQKCTDDEDCEGYTSACSDTTKSTEDTCGTCDVAGKSTELTCGTCVGDTSKTTQATCVSECQNSNYTTEATCGSCDDTSKLSVDTCVDTCYDYSSSTKVFGSLNCSGAADCEQKCTDASNCQGWTSACSVTDKTTAETCGTCSGSGTTKDTCGTCNSDNTKSTEATCDAVCANPAYTSEATCGTCDDPSKLSVDTCVDTCYDYSSSIKVFDNSSCSGATDCEQKCSDASNCQGWTSACSVTDKTTAETCGTCTGSGTTENTCGTCSAPSRVTLDTCKIYVTDVAGGESATCYIDVDGMIFCMGVFGNLGQGADPPNGPLVPTAVTMPAGLTATKIHMQDEMSFDYACAIMSDEKIYCWGWHYHGNLGIDPAPTSKVATPTMVKMPTGLTAKQVTTGHSHTCAIMSDDNLYCWGYNLKGQLGIGTTTNQHVPTAVTMPTVNGNSLTAKQVALGHRVSCAIMSDNNIYCWGQNENGLLGTGSSDESLKKLVPTAVTMPAGLTAKQLDVSAYGTCAIMSDDNIYCWGQNGQGALGIGSSDDNLIKRVPTAVTMPVGLTAKQVTTAAYFQRCAIMSDDTIYCWGDGVGGGSDHNVPTAITMPSGLKAKKIDAGLAQFCAIMDNDSLYCFGENENGQLGIDSTVDQSTL
ncbi:MAG: hypothetical protein CMO44_19735, partial [Verrucomicrobiales bacterium]|nr:hypothetical protein [Verrucomicrobiales bacterium]